jgi:hypothetical protein
MGFIMGESADIKGEMSVSSLLRAERREKRVADKPARLSARARVRAKGRARIIELAKLPA